MSQAAARFKERRYWKIFPIALGAEAAPDYLRQTVADPSGGEVIVAQHDTDLLNSYIEVYARAGDNRFIDRVLVQPNTLAPLIDVQANQQVTQISVVVVRDGGATISSLLAPGDADVVQPFYQNTVRRGAEPEYDLYSVPPEAQVGMTGRWMINVDRADQQPTTVVVLSRSALRARMPVPAPLSDDDDGGLRYQPFGRPMLLEVVAQVAQRNDSDSISQPFVYKWVTGMAPSVMQIAPDAGPAVTLTDDGRVYDADAQDGRYTGLYPPFAGAGDYTLQLELPHGSDDPIHIRRNYIVRVASLPTMTVTLPPDATTLPINTAFTGLIELPGRADFVIEKIAFATAFIKRPDGVLDKLGVQPDDQGRFRFAYTPNFAGAYTIGIAAEVRGRGPMGSIRYVDYAEAQAGVPEAVPVVSVSAAFTETLAYDSKGLLNVPLQIDSRSPEQEELQVSIQGAQGSTPVQSRVLLAPNEAAQRTVAVLLPAADRPANGELTLVLSAPDQRVIVEGGAVAVPYRARGGLLRIVGMLLLVVLIAGGFLGFKRWQRRRQARVAATPHTPRRVS